MLLRMTISDLPGGSEITINGLHKKILPIISNDYRLYIHHVQDFHFISQATLNYTFVDSLLQR